MAHTRLRLRVAPGARTSALVGRHGGAWKVRVTAAPEQGRANTAVENLLAELLSLPRDAVSVVAGHTVRDKVVEIDGMELADAEGILDAHLAGSIA